MSIFLLFPPLDWGLVIMVYRLTFLISILILFPTVVVTMKLKYVIFAIFFFTIPLFLKKQLVYLIACLLLIPFLYRILFPSFTVLGFSVWFLSILLLFYVLQLQLSSLNICNTLPQSWQIKNKLEHIPIHEDWESSNDMPSFALWSAPITSVGTATIIPKSNINKLWATVAQT